jgi:hypothetical protein
MAVDNYKTVKGATALLMSDDRTMTESEFDALWVGGVPADGGELLLVDFVTTPVVKAVALVQSLQFGETGDTEEILDLSDADADYANPEVSKKSGSGSASVFQLVVDSANGTISIDDAEFEFADNLRVGDIVMVAKADYPLAASSKVHQIYRAVITSTDGNNSPSESGTLDISFESKGKIYYGVSISAT